MNIESLRTMVQLDLEIDESNLHTESIKTPQLHNKYLVFYQNSKLELEKLELEEKILQGVINAQNEFNIRSTPSFLIDGMLVEGNKTIKEFRQIIDKILSE